MGVLVLGAAGLLAGCSSGSTSGSAAAPTAGSAAASSAAPSVTSSATPTESPVSSSAPGADCQSVVNATSKNVALQAAAKKLYAVMDCASSTSLGDQLAAAYSDPAFQKQAKAAGWTIALNKVDVGGGSTAIALTDLTTQSSCQVQAIADPRTKGLICGDV
jgi:hypothetical protein